MIKAKIFDGDNLIREIELPNIDAFVAVISTAAVAFFRLEVVCDFSKKSSDNEN